MDQRFQTVTDFETVINLICLRLHMDTNLTEQPHISNEYFIDYKCPCGSCMSVLGNTKWTK